MEIVDDAPVALECVFIDGTNADVKAKTPTSAIALSMFFSYSLVVSA